VEDLGVKFTLHYTTVYEQTDLVKQAIEINMNTISIGWIKQDIFTMSITQTKDISNHRHHGGCTTITETTVIPVSDGK
jgi:hypothetical protein